MNYLIIQNSKTPSTKVPPNVIQMFSDEEMVVWGKFLDAIPRFFEKDMSGPETEVSRRMLDLWKQWEKETQ